MKLKILFLSALLLLFAFAACGRGEESEPTDTDDDITGILQIREGGGDDDDDENDEGNANDDDEIFVIVDDRVNIPLRSYFPWIHDEDFADLMPVFDRLNDPFTFFAYSVGADAEVLAAYGIPADGRVTTAEHWELRRGELRDLIMYYYFGFKWPTTYENVTVNTAVRPAADGVIDITVNERRRDGTEVSADGVVATGVWLPTFEQLEANGFWCTESNTGTGGPLLIAVFHGFSEEQREEFLSRGIGLAIANTQGMDGWNEARTGMYFDLFPFDRYITEYNTGTLMASAWVFSRVIDAFQLNPEWGVNPNAIATLGNSFAGKRALFAGVMDERVALTIPHESGGDGGVAPFRHSHAGRIHFYNSDGVNRVHSRHETARTGNTVRGAQEVASFFRRTAPYEESIYLLPFDMHLVIAMTAPTAANPNRAFLSLETDNFGTWTGWSAARTVNAAAAEVFHFLGSGNIAFRQRHSSHSLHDSDYPVIWAILDYLFGQPVHDTGTGFRGWRLADQIYVEDVWGAALPGVSPGGVSALSRSPVEVDSAWMPWSQPGVHTLWTDTQIIGAGLPATIVAYTSAPRAELVLLENGTENRMWLYGSNIIDTWTADAADGRVIFELAADEVQVGRFQLWAGSDGIDYLAGDTMGRTVFFQAIDAHTALRHGTTRDNIGGAGAATMIGFTSRINPDTIRTYQRGADGEETAITPTTFQGGGHWIMPYGVRLGGISGTGDERAHILRGLQFEAMPGFTFELSLQENLYTADQPPAIWQASPAAQIVGPYPHWRPGGTGARPTTGPLAPAALRPTNFDITMTHAFDGDTWIITFSSHMNTRDFGIGFNFSEKFSLEWNDQHSQLTVTFEDIFETDERIMYIFRARAEGANSPNDVINTPVRVVK